MILTTKADWVVDFIRDTLSNWGVSSGSLNLITLFIMLGLGILTLWLMTVIIRRILLNFLAKAFQKTPIKFDDYLLKNKVLLHLARIVPLFLLLGMVPTIFVDFPEFISLATTVLQIALVVGWVLVLRGVFRAIRDTLQSKKEFQDKPLDSYLQVAVILLFFVAGVVIFTLLSGQSPWAFLGAFGAMSAVLMLVFKDTILGFVASIQVSTNDMVRVGDWIEMPKYGADGDVIEINLNTVKIQNWDKTISTIPTYYLITDSFKNWRGMQETGGRRIKRAINIKISSIRFLTEKEIQELTKIQLLKSYIEERQAQIDEYNAKTQADRSMPVNGRNMTNVGLFRQYINQMVQNHPLIRTDMTMLVRQLQPTQYGLPLELYMFVGDVRWATYENVMSDIFDHLLAVIKYFDLEVFESPASDDIRMWVQAKQSDSKE